MAGLEYKILQSIINLFYLSINNPLSPIKSTSPFPSCTGIWSKLNVYFMGKLEGRGKQLYYGNTKPTPDGERFHMTNDLVSSKKWIVKETNKQKWKQHEACQPITKCGPYLVLI